MLSLVILAAIVQNLFLATRYNVIATSLATKFIPSLMISPVFGAAVMSTSTVTCAMDVQLFKREKE